MKKLIALLLCFVMVVGVMAGCSKGDSLVGTWEAKVDMGKILNETMGSSLDGSGEYFDFSGIELTVLLTFEDDGTYAMAGDKEATSDMVNALKEKMRTGMGKYFEDAIAEMGLDITVDELLAQSNMSMEDLLNEAFSDEMVDEMIEDMATDGEYEIKGGKLYLDGDACEYELNGKKLTIDAPESGSSDMAELFPLEFKKIK